MKTRKSRPMTVTAICTILLGCILFCSLFVFAACGMEQSTAVTIPEVSVSQLSQNTSEDYLSVPYLSQESIMPTGCELVCAVMVLNYYGIDISVDTFVDNYVAMEPIFVNENGILQEPNPNKAFVGNPRNYASYGCYASVVTEAMNLASNSSNAYNTTGLSLDQLTERYIENRIPVLVWVTINMAPSRSGDSWYVEESGTMFTWTAGEHCMVLVGADATGYYLLDPYNSNGLIYCDKEAVAQRHSELGYQSVVYLPS